MNQLQLRTTVAGIINGGMFTAEGTGAWDGDSSTNTLVFDRPLINASPMMCSTWKCNHHRVLPPWEEGEGEGLNPFARMLVNGTRLTVKSQAVYPEYDGEIECVAVISRPDATTQLVEQTRIGHYAGPCNIVRQEGYTQVFRYGGPGRADGEYTRGLWTEDGQRFEAKYVEEVFFPIYADFVPFVVRFDVLTASYRNNVFAIQLRPRALRLETYERMLSEQAATENVRA